MKKLAGTAAALLALGLFATPASAQYPPTEATCGVSDTVLGAGDQVRVSGDGWQPGSEVDLTLEPEGVGLGSATVGGGGGFSVTVTIPDGISAGPHTISCSGVDAEGVTQVLGSDVQVVGEPAEAGLAGTGATFSLPLVLTLVAVLLLAGVAAVIVGRRREHRAANRP